MLWIFLSLLAAFGQALGWALKKRALDQPGINNTIAAVTFLVAGLVFVLLFLLSREAWPLLAPTFWWSALVVIAANVLAVWAAYRVLDKTAFSRLMPFIALTALAIVPIEYWLRGIVPSQLQLLGMGIVVGGALLFARRLSLGGIPWRVAGYFSLTVIAYALASAVMGVAVAASGSGIFTAAVLHLGIALGFAPFVWLAHEGKGIRQLRHAGKAWSLLRRLAVIGLVVALLENGPATLALETASASEVFSLKRTMPFFALFLGAIMFNERIERRHILATCLLVLGSAMIVWFR